MKNQVLSKTESILKKTILLAAFPLALGLSSCGGGGPEADAQKLCGMMKEWKKAKEEGKTEEADRIEADGKKLSEELREKYKGDEEGRKVLEAKMEACENEVEGDH